MRVLTHHMNLCCFTKLSPRSAHTTKELWVTYTAQGASERPRGHVVHEQKTKPWPYFIFFASPVPFHVSSHHFTSISYGRGSRTIHRSHGSQRKVTRWSRKLVTFLIIPLLFSGYSTPSWGCRTSSRSDEFLLDS
jgi:hypothetical protein